jgi:hypothetical protein
MTGLEPAFHGFAIRCVTNSATCTLVPDRGFEPHPTQSQCGMQPLHLVRHNFGTPEGTRTPNLHVRSVLL